MQNSWAWHWWLLQVPSYWNCERAFEPSEQHLPVPGDVDDCQQHEALQGFLKRWPDASHVAARQLHAPHRLGGGLGAACHVACQLHAPYLVVSQLQGASSHAEYQLGDAPCHVAHHVDGWHLVSHGVVGMYQHLEQTVADSAMHRLYDPHQLGAALHLQDTRYTTMEDGPASPPHTHTPALKPNITMNGLL